MNKAYFIQELRPSLSFIPRHLRLIVGLIYMGSSHHLIHPLHGLYSPMACTRSYQKMVLYLVNLMSLSTIALGVQQVPLTDQASSPFSASFDELVT